MRKGKEKSDKMCCEYNLLASRFSLSFFPTSPHCVLSFKDMNVVHVIGQRWALPFDPWNMSRAFMPPSWELAGTGDRRERKLTSGILCAYICVHEREIERERKK